LFAQGEASAANVFWSDSYNNAEALLIPLYVLWVLGLFTFKVWKYKYENIYSQ